MKKTAYILLILLIGIICAASPAIPKYNNVYLNKNKIDLKLLNTPSGDYISLNELLLKFLKDFRRHNKYSISESGIKIEFIPSSIFIKCTSNNLSKIVQLSKPIISLKEINDSVFIAIEDIETIFNQFNLYIAKNFNNDLIVDNLSIENPVKKNDDNPSANNNTHSSVTSKKESSPKERIIQTPDAGKDNSSVNQPAIPNVYQIPDKLIRRNIK